MYVSQLPFLRDHWYPVAVDGVLGRDLPVRLFGAPFRVTFDGTGEPCVTAPAPTWRTPRPLPVRRRYGLVWTTVGEPVLDDPPTWPEAELPGWRTFVEFFETWSCSAPRVIDNNLDNSHVAYVHRTTFGDPDDAHLARPAVSHTDDPYFRAVLSSEQKGLGVQLGVTGDEAIRFGRTSTTELVAPLTTHVRMRFDGDVPDYAFFGVATPIDDHTSIYVRLSALAGSEQEQPWDRFHAFGTRVKEEDRIVLETTVPDFPIDVTSEVHLRCDSATLAYRRTLASLYAQHESSPPLQEKTWPST